MRYARLGMVMLLCACSLFKASAGNPVWMQSGETIQQKSVLFIPVHTQKQAVDLCREYRRKQIAGFVLMPAGAAAFAGGVVMVYKGISNISANYSQSNYENNGPLISKHNQIYIWAGTGLIFTGVALFPGGLIMSGIARIQYCKYCRGGGAMYFSPSQTGTGLTFNF